MRHFETHSIHNINWLRAFVLGANDGIVSTCSLIIGVATASNNKENMIIAGLAGAVAGAMSMAAGEYVSVSSQSDSEEADLKKETKELLEQPEHELEELTQIYMNRGLSATLATQVAKELTAHNALEAHARDELGIMDFNRASPITAAIASALAFALGAFIPIIITHLTPMKHILIVVSISSLVLLGLLGAVSAKWGGASKLKSISRVVFWGMLAMIITGVIGKIFGVNV